MSPQMSVLLPAKEIKAPSNTTYQLIQTHSYQSPGGDDKNITHNLRQHPPCDLKRRRNTLFVHRC